jgi:hypothetical protein
MTIFFYKKHPHNSTLDTRTESHFAGHPVGVQAKITVSLPVGEIPGCSERYTQLYLSVTLLVIRHKYRSNIRDRKKKSDSMLPVWSSRQHRKSKTISYYFSGERDYRM